MITRSTSNLATSLSIFLTASCRGPITLITSRKFIRRKNTNTWVMPAKICYLVLNKVTSRCIYLQRYAI